MFPSPLRKGGDGPSPFGEGSGLSHRPAPGSPQLASHHREWHNRHGTHTQDTVIGHAQPLHNPCDIHDTKDDQL